MKHCLRTKGWRAGLLAVVLWFVIVVPGLAHDPGLSRGQLSFRPSGIEMTLGLSARDLKALLQVGPAGEETSAKEREAAFAGAALSRIAGDAVEVRSAGRPVPVTVRSSTIEDDGGARIELLATCVEGRGEVNLQSRWLALLPAGHRQFWTAQEIGGETVQERLLSAGDDTFTVVWPVPGRNGAGMETNEKEMVTGAGAFVEFLGHGVKHILIGYDHLLFLLSLLLVSRRLGDTLKVITCFTAAHSVTLTLAAFDWVRLPGWVVEPLIAASIVVVAVGNLRTDRSTDGRGWLVFAFGLIHGLGFASVLRDLGLGTSGRAVSGPLVGFNLGVELGQMLIAVPVVLLLRQLRARPTFERHWVPVCSGAAALEGAFWFVQRLVE